MKTKDNRTSTVIEKFKIAPAERIEILWKSITKGNDNYDFYDVKYGDILITGCRIVSGKNGDFLAMPSKENNGEYYPVVFISHALGDRLIEYINDADESDTWKEVDTNEMLNFGADSNRKEKSRSKRKKGNDAENESN